MSNPPPSKVPLSLLEGSDSDAIERKTFFQSLTKSLYLLWVQANSTLTSQVSALQTQVTSGLSRSNHTGTQAYATLVLTGSIVQGDLNATTDNVSTASTTGAGVTLPGGQYGFFPQLKTNDTNYTATWGDSTGYVAATTSASYATLARLRIANAAASAFLQQTYINACRPYDLGDGEVRRFIFLTILPNGKIESVYNGQTAPWHYNGRTNIAASEYRNGKGYRKVTRAVYENIVNDVNLSDIKDKSKRKNIEDILSDKNEYELEITQAVKNKDMVLIPHPFVEAELSNKTVVLLDPVSPLCDQIDVMQTSGEDVNELFHGGYFKIGNTAINRKSPVMCVDFSWK